MNLEILSRRGHFIHPVQGGTIVLKRGVGIQGTQGTQYRKKQ